MAAIFKIVFAFFALVAIVSAVQPTDAKGNAKGEAKQAVTQSTPVAQKLPVEAVAAKAKAAENHLPSSASESHHRHKRGCKKVSYTKNGKTYTVEKC